MVGSQYQAEIPTLVCNHDNDEKGECEDFFVYFHNKYIVFFRHILFVCAM